MISFYPRVCSHIEWLPTVRSLSSYGDERYYEYVTMAESGSVNAENFVLMLYSTNGRGENELDASIPSLEKEIKLSYQTAASSSSESDGDGLALIEMEYRTTGIRKLNICAKDAVLFGKEPGVSLNDYFDIVLYMPDFIASSDTQSLVYGFDSTKPTGISEWLSLSPLAQPSMYFHLNTIPDEAPLNTCFIVQMETSAGVVLADTTFSVRLIP
jgi:hypothetical protein